MRHRPIGIGVQVRPRTATDLEFRVQDRALLNTLFCHEHQRSGAPA